jgi:hypothetical protein
MLEFRSKQQEDEVKGGSNGRASTGKIRGPAEEESVR